MSFYKGNLADDAVFDVIYNRGKMSESEIVDSIMKLAENRMLI